MQTDKRNDIFLTYIDLYQTANHQPCVQRLPTNTNVHKLANGTKEWPLLSL